MPSTYVIDPERRLVVTTASGTVTAEEAFSHQERLAADPKFRPEFDQLMDCTEMTKVRLDSTQLRALAERTFFSPESRRAVLVRSAFAFGIGRMLATFREIAGGKEEIRIFQDRDEALRWLTMPKPAAKNL